MPHQTLRDKCLVSRRWGEHCLPAFIIGELDCSWLFQFQFCEVDWYFHESCLTNINVVTFSSVWKTPYAHDASWLFFEKLWSNNGAAICVIMYWRKVGRDVQGGATSKDEVRESPGLEFVLWFDGEWFDLQGNESVSQKEGQSPVTIWWGSIAYWLLTDLFCIANIDMLTYKIYICVLYISKTR